MEQLTKMFEGHEIRIVGNEENPLFMLADVCEVLGLSNPSEVSKRVREKYKHKISLGLHGRSPIFVNEQGLYQVIMRADNSPVAERFQDWVYEDVLPSIRRSGSYQLPDVSPERLTLMLAQQHAEQAERLNVIEHKLDQQMTIDYAKQQALLNAKNIRVETLWNNADWSSSIFDTKKKLHARAWRDLKNAFGASSYKDIRQKDYDEAMNYMRAWRPSLY